MESTHQETEQALLGADIQYVTRERARTVTSGDMGRNRTALRHAWKWGKLKRLSLIVEDNSIGLPGTRLNPFHVRFGTRDIPSPGCRL